MPKRSERDVYQASFSGNPYGDTPVEGMYKRLRWGNSPADSWEINGPEDMATLGELAKLYRTARHRLCSFKEGAGPFVAVGKQSNIIYIVPRRENGSPVDVPDDLEQYVGICEVSRIDYYSDKGGDICYYYHNHEAPYPCLYQHDCGVGILMPSDNNGERSYVVDDAGIIG